MNETIKKRKTQVLQQLQEEYAEQPRSWWQSKAAVYETTASASKAGNNSLRTSEEIIIRYDLKRALIGSALFFIFYGLIFCFNSQFGEKENEPPDTFGICIFAVFMLYPIIKTFNRKPRLVLNRQGIWLQNINETIAWKNIIASYIKKDDSGDSTTYFLVLHYYDEAADLFTQTTYDLSGLDINQQDLALMIECWIIETKSP